MHRDTDIGRPLRRSESKRAIFIQTEDGNQNTELYHYRESSREREPGIPRRLPRS